MRCEDEAWLRVDVPQNKKLVEAMDENHDGVITFQEFLSFNKE